MQVQMYAYNAEYELEAEEPHDKHPQAHYYIQRNSINFTPAEAASRSAAEVQKRIYMSKMGMFEGHLATPLQVMVGMVGGILAEGCAQQGLLVCYASTL